ncbi:MAG: hypothetical protein QM779_07900 [Propionicimonas sp.]|uniref:aggregation-promoting factor C-terminal-like domain-containing protein n=1 Tax=Propionicimonas sp. TaxID=1955623 RepID=UPI003D12A4C3
MLNHRSVRKAIVALSALIGLSPFFPASTSDAAPMTVSSTGSSTSTTTTTDDLAAYRQSLLAKQSSAISIGNATMKALYEQKVAELGYDPVITDPREIAREIMKNKYGWGEDQFTCYNAIIMRESKWDTYADNPYSSAYGIPQALPGSKMASFGSDWRTNPATQIRWGLDYVDQRYGTPCGAWGFKRAHGWY